uniref:Uncharacterized protein n=1 Tax=uncultured marine microorganism TaxID=415540 RepID=A5CFU8_9ZZZZ|nr:hypothetical protein [uncultured marine microorganism]
MRDLEPTELSFVSGAGEECSSGSGNNIGGVTNSSSLGQDLINIYEAVVAATSHVIERVADALYR